MIYSRECPQCKDPIIYKNKWYVTKSEKNRTKCKKCVSENKTIKRELKKDCPSCGIEIIFNAYSTYNRSIRLNSDCMVCANKKCIERGKLYTGENNPFFGKKHTQETKDKLSKSWTEPTEGRQKQLDYKQSDEWKEETKRRFTNYNTNRESYGSFKDIWTRKYGEVDAENREKQWKDLLSEKSSGENNNMFGKPAPVGSGNGWSGWYKGWYFRSLSELSYMVLIIERFNFNWENGETKSKFKISYIDYDKTNRNYYPDFVLNNKYMIEIKPTSLWESESVLRKKEAAEQFCKEKGLIYKLTNCSKLSVEKILELYVNNNIKFLDRYEEKFLLYIKKHLSL